MAEFVQSKEAAENWPWKRIVVGIDEAGESYCETQKVTNVIRKEGFCHRAEIWCGAKVPVDNTLAGDLTENAGSRREPAKGGFLARNLMLFPDPNPVEHAKLIAQLHQDVMQSHTPSEKDYARSLNMHRTHTLDVITCVTGEIWMVTDKDEVLMRPGDTVVVKGANHSWENRSDAPCLLAGVMIDAEGIDYSKFEKNGQTE